MKDRLIFISSHVHIASVKFKKWKQGDGGICIINNIHGERFEAVSSDPFNPDTALEEAYDLFLKDENS